jgi:hypothetical protein
MDDYCALGIDRLLVDEWVRSEWPDLFDLGVYALDFEDDGSVVVHHYLKDATGRRYFDRDRKDVARGSARRTPSIPPPAPLRAVLEEV